MVLITLYFVLGVLRLDLEGHRKREKGESLEPSSLTRSGHGLSTQKVPACVMHKGLFGGC